MKLKTTCAEERAIERTIKNKELQSSTVSIQHFQLVDLYDDYKKLRKFYESHGQQIATDDFLASEYGFPNK